MAPTKPSNRGGRPPIPWSSSRRRKLVRLYTLTTLKMDELREVLQDGSFHPRSVRNIEQELRALFPRDYSTHHRDYRPTKENNVRSRFDHLRRCREARISKRPARIRLDRSIIWKQEQQALQKLETESQNMALSFRSYQISTSDRYEGAVANLKDSELVAPSMLMLDGSTMQPQDAVGFTSPGYHDSSKLSGDRRASPPESESSQATSNIRVQIESSLSFSVATPVRPDLIGKRTRDTFSNECCSHIQTVLRFSTSDSWRSSLESFSSMISWRSAGSLDNQSVLTDGAKNFKVTKDDAKSQKSSTPRKLIRMFGKSRRTSGRNETQNHVHPGKQIFPSQNEGRQLKLLYRCMHSWVAPLTVSSRACCVRYLLSRRAERCEECGFLGHEQSGLRATSTIEFSGIPWMTDDLDFFGNSMLHFIAERMTEDNINTLRHLLSECKSHHQIAPGQSMSLSEYLNRTNTQGYTFMHIISGRTISRHCLEAYRSFLKQLIELGFDCSKRDYHGKNIIHHLVQSSKTLFDPDYPSSFRTSEIEELLCAVNLDYGSLDNSGLTCTPYSRHKPLGMVYSLQDLSEWPSGIRKGIEYISHRDRLNLMFDGEVITAAILDLWGSENIDLFDLAGDTPLIALLKEWKDTINMPLLEDIVKELLEHGAEIHMRDRDGNAPIAIASVRGFRSTLKLLLENGANVQSRDYQGSGILSQIEDALDKARWKGNDELYARIMSCWGLLISAGAKANPSARDEWILPSAVSLSEKKSEPGGEDIDAVLD